MEGRGVGSRAPPLHAALACCIPRPAARRPPCWSHAALPAPRLVATTPAQFDRTRASAQQEQRQLQKQLAAQQEQITVLEKALASAADVRGCSAGVWPARTHLAVWLPACSLLWPHTARARSELRHRSLACRSPTRCARRWRSRRPPPAGCRPRRPPPTPRLPASARSCRRRRRRRPRRST